jgi:hypothetical protein
MWIISEIKKTVLSNDLFKNGVYGTTLARYLDIHSTRISMNVKFGFSPTLTGRDLSPKLSGGCLTWCSFTTGPFGRWLCHHSISSIKTI